MGDCPVTWPSKQVNNSEHSKLGRARAKGEIYIAVDPLIFVCLCDCTRALVRIGFTPVSICFNHVHKNAGVVLAT